jgi:hypothetical protein
VRSMSSLSSNEIGPQEGRCAEAMSGSGSVGCVVWGGGGRRTGGTSTVYRVCGRAVDETTATTPSTAGILRLRARSARLGLVLEVLSQQLVQHFIPFQVRESPTRQEGYITTIIRMVPPPRRSPYRRRRSWAPRCGSGGLPLEQAPPSCLVHQDPKLPQILRPR